MNIVSFRQWTCATVAVSHLLFALAAFGIQEQDMADPVTTSAVPQPDWLFMFFFQVIRYFQDSWEMLGVFWIPAALFLGLLLLPLIDRRQTSGTWLRCSVIPCCIALYLACAIVTFHSSSTTPIWSCAACHKEDFGEAFGNTPREVADFSHRYDNKWLALHYRYPQYFWMMDAEVPAW